MIPQLEDVHGHEYERKHQHVEEGANSLFEDHEAEQDWGCHSYTNARIRVGFPGENFEFICSALNVDYVFA